MTDASQALSALEDSPRARLDDALRRCAIDADELPDQLMGRLVDRARQKDKRLVVGRYLLLGDLGRGGMGVVYDAWDPGIERRVAIKTVEPKLVPEEEREEVVARFRREAKVVGQLHHPAIVTIFDSGREREVDPVTKGRGTTLYYYVMEYLEGQSLARALRERRVLPDIEAVAIAADIADALQLSHDARVIHRDIKPSNIFLRNNKEAVLLDFGIAKTGSLVLTRQGQILGTPSYLAPERLREKEVAIDGRADIFSLGVLLFTMLTGETPFVGEDVYEVIDKIAKESHPKLARSTPSGLALSRVIDKMLAKKPIDRYQSAGVLAEALKEVLHLFRLTSESQLTEDIDVSVRVREPIPEAQVTDPSQAVVPGGKSPPDDEASTGPIAQPPISGALDSSAALQVSARPVKTALMPSLAGPITDSPITQVDPKKVESAEIGTETEEVRRAEDRATEVARSNDPRATRPELSLQRETRELRGRNGSSGLLETEDELPDIGDVPVVDTSPSLPPFEDTERSGGDVEYQDHSPANEEPTDSDAMESERRPRAHESEVETDQVRRTGRPGRAEKEEPDNQHAPRRSGSMRRRSPIEASLVDEEDVVVKPAPLGSLNPDEVPTQTGFQIPTSSPRAQVFAPPVSSSFDVVRARGDSRVEDPAEAPNKAKKPTVSDLSEAPARAGPSPMPSDMPASAAVARRTFAKTRQQSQRGVHVRVRGKPLSASAEERMRMIRRNGVLLVAGVLVAVAIGLMLGRAQQPTLPALQNGKDEPQPKVEPRASAVKRLPGTGEPDLVRPRPAKGFKDAQAARAEGQLEDAARLFESAIEAAASKSTIRPRAMLGRADVLKQSGKRKPAVDLYRSLIRSHPKSEAAAQAKVALAGLGLPVWPQKPKPATQDGTTKRKAPAPPPAPTPKKAPEPLALTEQMSADQKCKLIIRRTLSDPAEAVRELEGMRSEHRRAPCIYWNLGKKYEKLSKFSAALSSYRYYLSLYSKSPKRPAVERKIADLEAKLKQR